jgi:hypothetical protein
MAANLIPITSDGGFTTSGNIEGNYFIGNGSQLTGISGGGGGAAISNGTSYANVVASNGNVVIGVDDDNMTWTFATDRKIYGLLDEDVIIVAVDDGNDSSVRQQVVDDNLDTLSETRLEPGDFYIQFDLDGGGNSWRFDNGSLRPPDGGAFEQFDGNIRMYAMNAGSNPVASLQSVSNQNDPNIFSTFDATTTGANISVYNGGSNGGVGYTWQFGNNGALTLPGGSTIDQTSNVSTNINVNGNAWAFGVNGDLTVPGGLINDTAIVLSAPAVFNICTILTGGSGYNAGSSLKTTTGGSGTGMTVGIGYGLSNQLTSVNVVDPGTGYVNGDVITVSDGTGGTFAITKYNQSANQTNNNTVQTDLIFANNTLTIPVDGNLVGNLIVPGYIVGSGASPAPYISGFSSANFAGNVTANYFLGNGQTLTGLAGANVTGTVANANLSQYLNVSDVNNNFSYHVVLSAGSGDKSLHIDADDNLQYNPADGTLTSTRVDATYVLANLNFSNGYLASNLVGSVSNIVNGNSNVNIPTANGNVVTTVNGSAILTTYSGGIKVGGSGILQSPGGASAITLNNNGANIPTANITNTLNVTGAGGANITANLTAGNNISATGNVTANNFIGNGGGLSNVATSTTGSWTLASGVNTVSISVPLNGTYALWVNGNIPNGIVVYTATAVVTNTNVPVLGSQYAWYYALGNALVITSIPDQFVGTAGSISTVNPYSGNAANVFTFGITNNSGNSAVVNYGYTKL